jgi:hypothetical protein
MCDLVNWNETPKFYLSEFDIEKTTIEAVGDGIWLTCSDNDKSKYKFKCKHPGWFKRWEYIDPPLDGSGEALYCEPGTLIRAEVL